jgi:hypothetical protein
MFAVLAEVAPEIALLMETSERRDGVSRIIDKCISTGESWVAKDGRGVVEGFIVVEPDEMERFQRSNGALHLAYAGVAKSQRERGIFCAPLQCVMNREVPLTATVRFANQSGMAERLKRIGFCQTSVDSSREQYEFIRERRPSKAQTGTVR